MKLFVFVIMPNHIHIVVQCSEEYPLSDVIRDFKKFTTRQIYHQFNKEEVKIKNPWKTSVMKKKQAKPQNLVEPRVLRRRL